ERARRDYWESYLRRRRELPASVVKLIDQVDRLNTRSAVGFRRRNMASLLSKYFIDMTAVFDGIGSLLKPGAPAFVVIGSNHTIAGGQRIEIPTAALLGELARSRGFVLTEAIPMEMLVSRDIFKKNASESETIICLRKPD